MLKGAFAPVWERADRGGGMALGSLGAFLVLESRAHASARGARPLARLANVQAARSKRQPGAVQAVLKRMWESISPQLQRDNMAVVSGATGAEPATQEERVFLGSIGDVPVRATGTYIGHGLEPQFPMNIALATLVLGREKLPPPAGTFERTVASAPSQIVVTGVGHWRSEGMALVERV
jgi:3-oxoacyl-[acyl-carrier-protein] synthase II